MKLILEVSGEHPEIPFAEVSAVLPVYHHSTQVLITDAPDITILDRFSYTHLAMRYIGECKADRDSFIRMLKTLNLTIEKPFCGRVKKMADHGMDARSVELERLIGYYISGPVSVSSPEHIFRVLIADGHCYLGEVLWEIDLPVEKELSLKEVIPVTDD